MKKYLILLFSLFTVLAAEAQLAGDGYYRVQNYGTKRWAYLRDNYGKIDMGSQQADCGAIQLWKNAPLYHDPASIIYVRKVAADMYDLEGQGTGLYQIISHYVTVMDRSTASRKNTYWVYASQSGITKYLDDDETGDADDGACGFNRTGDYRFWSVFKVDGDANYLGVTPTVKVGSDYYQPYYASFPFSKTSAIKVYYISKVDPKLSVAVLSEFTGDVVPAGMPVLIKCTGSLASQNKIMPVVSSVKAPSDNQLKGVFFNTPKRLKVTKDAAKAYDGATMRVLGVTKSGKLGFINSTSSLTAYKNVYYLNANQSYLPVASGTPDELNIMTAAEYEELTAYRVVTAEAGPHGKVTVIPMSDRYKLGTTIQVTATPDKGYSFVSWSNGVKDNPYTFQVSADLKLTASFAVNQYTLTFDPNGGSSVASITQDYGTAVTAPANPTRTGYTFAGWDQVVPATMPDQNMTFKAKWTINSYTLTYNTNGGSEVPSTTHDYGSTVTAPADPVKEGYTFNGWQPAIPTVMPAGNLTLTAQWKVNRYTITFDADGGSEVSPITQDYGTHINTPAAPTRQGYSFAGWDTAIPSTMPSQDMTIKAIWKINQYTLTFNSKGGTDVPAITQDYQSEVVAPSDPVREGYTFVGWDSELPTTMPAANMTFNAQWKANQYKVVFMSGEEVVYQEELDYGMTIIAPANPEREGYTFSGWSPTFTNGATVPVGGITYTAIYKVNPYKIIYMVDGEAYATEGYDFGEAVTAVAEPILIGHTFSGWSEIPETMPASDVIVTGSFTVNQYQVTFLDEAGHTIQTALMDYNAEITAPQAPEREGYTFVGWSPSVDQSVPAQDVSYTAQYEVNTYKVRYYFGNELLAEYDVAYQEAMPDFIWTPDAGNIIFKEWKGETYESMPAHDVDYVADYTDGLRGIMAGATSVNIHTLDGKFVKKAASLKEAQLPAGIYIVNGRKVVVR